MKLQRLESPSFSVRFEFLKTEFEQRSYCLLTGERTKQIIEPGTPVLVGNADGKKIIVTPFDVRKYDLVEATDAERATLEEYGFRWLILG